MYSDYNVNGRSDLRAHGSPQEEARTERGFSFSGRVESSRRTRENGEKFLVKGANGRRFKKKLKHMQEGVLTSGQLQ